MSSAGGERPLRVALATDFFVRYTSDLARGLADRGAQVLLLTRDHDEEFGHRRGEMRAYVARTLGGTAQHVMLRGRVREAASLRSVGRAARRRRALAPDVVHLQDGAANDPRLLVAAGIRRGRYALTVHDPVLHPGDRRPRAHVRLARTSLIHGAGLVFVHGEALRAELLDSHRLKAPVEVVPHGVVPEPFAELPEAPSLLFFGRMSYYKGLDVLLDAMPAVWDAQPDVTLTVAGSGELPEHPVLADPRVVLRHEHVADAEVPAIFRAATCVVLPYRQASQSGVGAQAKTYGRPIVASAVGALGEQVTPASGRLVAPEDPRALAGAIREVVGDRSLAESMGRAAASAVDTSWSEVAALTLAAYRRHLVP